MGRAYSPPQSKAGLLLRLALAAASVWLLYTLLSTRGRKGLDELVDEDEEAAYSGWGFASMALRAGSRNGGARRPLEPHEMCGWETSIEVRHSRA